METRFLAEAAPWVKDFRLPRYEEIPNVGLYLEQCVKYINESLSPLPGFVISASMISNYVKQHLVDRPVKKQYSREQLAQLLFIALAKPVLALEHINTLFRLQQESYEAKVAYDYLCDEFENILQVVFHVKEEVAPIGVEQTEEKRLLRTTIAAIAHKIYLEQCFLLLKEDAEMEKAEA